MSAVPELRALTGLRGIAAWAVVLYHIRLAPAGLPAGVVRALSKGYLAVDFFFLLSGFVIWLRWHDRLRAGGPAAVPGFLKRRVARIWPLHLAMLAFAVALALVLAVTGRADDAAFPFAELPLHVALLQNWGFTGALAWNHPGWSISCEFGAYLLFPLLAFAIDWRRVPSWAVLAAAAALMTILHGVFAAAGAATLGTDIPRLGLVRCLLEFAGGGALAALWVRWAAAPALPAALAAMLAIGLLAGDAAETAVVPAAFAAALLALALTSGMRGPLAAAPLHWLGRISYATYLSHYLLWIAFKLAFVADPHAVPWGMIALYLALVLAASAALHRFVERPAQAWVNALRRPGPPARRRSSPAPARERIDRPRIWRS